MDDPQSWAQLLAVSQKLPELPVALMNVVASHTVKTVAVFGNALFVDLTTPKGYVRISVDKTGCLKVLPFRTNPRPGHRPIREATQVVEITDPATVTEEFILSLQEQANAACGQAPDLG